MKTGRNCTPSALTPGEIVAEFGMDRNHAFVGQRPETKRLEERQT